MKNITLTKGKIAIIDDEDFDKIIKFHWNAIDYDGKFFAGTSIKQKVTLMHRMIMGITDRTIQIKHQNGNGLDNRKINLIVKINKCTHPLYATWRDMKKRCYNKQNWAYEYYGGRGIIMCERWLNSFDNFLEDMGEKPSPKHSIDRYPDKNGNYEPTNCRWATQIEQANNKKQTRYVEYNGEQIPVKLLCRALNFDYTYMMRGIYRGMTIPNILKAYDEKVKRGFTIKHLKKRVYKKDK